MFKTISKLAVVVVVGLLPGLAQAEWEGGVNYAGPSLGLSFLGSTPQFGFNFERAIETESLGTIGIGGILRYWSYSEEWGGWGWYGNDVHKWTYRNILFGAQGSYHFPLDSETIDPWLGVTLAYDAASASWDGPDGDVSSPAVGGMWLSVGGGMRYFISPTTAIVARLGFGSLGYGALDIGMDFAF